MSRADAQLPRPATLRRAIGAAASDLYYNSLRLVGGNILWGITAMLAFFISTRHPLGLLLIVPLVPITAAVMFSATTLVRRKRLYFSDFTDGVRRSLHGPLALGVVEVGLILVAVVDLLIGLNTPAPFGPLLAISALYLLLGLWIAAVAVWPLALDPERDGEPFRDRVRLGLLLVLARPLRMSALAAVLGVLLLVSLVFTAAILSVSLVFAFLVAAHYVLPAADRLEGRKTPDAEDPSAA